MKSIWIKIYAHWSILYGDKGIVGAIKYIFFQNNGILISKMLLNIKALFVKEKVAPTATDSKETMPNILLNQSYPITTHPKISIIIPTKDKAYLVKQCIDSILLLSSYKNYEILLVDNNSNEPETFKLIDYYKEAYPDIFSSHAVKEPFNFSRLINIGASKATGDYLVLLNNDTKVITAQWLEYMLEYAQLDFVGAVGPKLLFEDDTIQHVGISVEGEGLPYHLHTRLAKTDPRVEFNKEYLALTAACLMVANTKFELVNGFDEAFEVEFNDIDFCLKLTEKGLKNVYVHKASLYHYESVSRGKSYKTVASYKRFLTEENLYITRWKKNKLIN